MKKAITITAIIGIFSPMIAFSAKADTAASFSPIHIRSLAASCAACHGTEGNAVPASNGQETTSSLAGANKNDIIQKLQAFKSGERSATVMHRHARGLNSEEITALAEYFSKQEHRQVTPLKSQKLQADHAN